MNDARSGSGEGALRILLVCTRDPGGRRTGRKAVLRTITTCLRRLGHTVDLAVLARGPLAAPAPEMADLAVRQLGVPGIAGAGVNALRYFSRGRLSLNECLFFSERGSRQLRRLVSEQGYDLVVADMIRAAPLVTSLTAPFVIDLDDRLSDRYRQLGRDGSDTSALLGYYAGWLPGPVRFIATRLAGRLLAREADVLGRREVEVARRSAGVSLVARDEADSLARDAGLPVFALPMAVDVSQRPAPVRENPGASMVFTGGLDYLANAESIRWFASAVLPELRRLVPGFALTVIGFCPDPLRVELERPGLVIAGYVADLDAELIRHRAFLAPIVTGRGIKTKVLEAMAAGLPVVSTPEGVSGLEVTDGVSCHLAVTAEGFAQRAAELADDPDRAAEIGAAGRDFVRAAFSTDVLESRWREMIAAALPGTRGQATRAGEL